MRRFVFTLFLLVPSVFCTEEEGGSYNYMSSLSKYEAIRGDVRDKYFDDSCTPIRFWILHRHATRYPSGEEITSIETLLKRRDEVLSNHAQGRGVLNSEQLDRLSNWTFDSSIEAIPMYLVSPTGFDETQRTAKRFKKRFPSLLSAEYSSDKFYFRHTDTERTTKTAESFIDGLFGDGAHDSIPIEVLPTSDDFLLYPFGACAALEGLTTDAENNSSMAANFTPTLAYTKALEMLSVRLGYEDTLPISALTTIFSACAYDSAWYQEEIEFGAWCPALNQYCIDVGEYYFDLEFYEMGGYGHEASERGACALAEDLWTRFATAVGKLDDSTKNQTSVCYFSHDLLIMLFHTALGLLKDEPSVSSYDFKEEERRQWKTSEIVPFAANVAAVLHECPHSEPVVLLLRNEHLWTGIPQCPDGICSWENFERLVKGVAESCNYSEFC